MHGRNGDTGGGGQGFPQLEAGTPQPWPRGDARNGPLGWACAHAHHYAVPGPGKGREPRATAATSSTGSRVRAGPRPGWVGAAPCPRSGCAPGRAQALRPPLGLRPRGPPACLSAPAAHTQAYLRAARPFRSPAAGTARPGPRTADTWRLPLKRPGLRGLSSSSAVRGGGGRGSEKRNQGRGGESSGERGKGTKRREGAARCAPPPSSAGTGDPGLSGDPVPDPRFLA